MSESFFERPILNSPYEYPARHWELDEDRQPTNVILPSRRRAQFLTPIPKPKKRSAKQREMVFDEGKGLSASGRVRPSLGVGDDRRRHHGGATDDFGDLVRVLLGDVQLYQAAGVA